MPSIQVIRRHDPNPPTLGDRCGTRVGIPEPVLDAVADRVDAWHERTGLPTLVADTGN
ncbi:hypothetical protein [Streptomyces sp. NPDC004296]|uniref:hypothetical protein n=1 Tax=Streptomyces sp. NPDC004296 TaxID=3364697 RepID=UPI00368AE343